MGGTGTIPGRETRNTHVILTGKSHGKRPQG